MGTSAKRRRPEPAAAVTAQGELNSVIHRASERFGGPRTGPVTASSAVAFEHHQPRRERTPCPSALGTRQGDSMMITVGGRRCGSGSLVTSWSAGDGAARSCGELDHRVEHACSAAGHDQPNCWLRVADNQDVPFLRRNGQARREGLSVLRPSVERRSRADSVDGCRATVAHTS